MKCWSLLANIKLKEDAILNLYHLRVAQSEGPENERDKYYRDAISDMENELTLLMKRELTAEQYAENRREFGEILKNVKLPVSK